MLESSYTNFLERKKLTAPIVLTDDKAISSQPITMIDVSSQFDKPISQNSYDSFISDLPFHALQCPVCNHFGCLNCHTYYTRKLRNPDGVVELSILRVICRSCDHIHAIVPDNIVPYMPYFFLHISFGPKICPHPLL